MTERENDQQVEKRYKRLPLIKNAISRFSIHTELIGTEPFEQIPSPLNSYLNRFVTPDLSNVPEIPRSIIEKGFEARRTAEKEKRNKTLARLNELKEEQEKASEKSKNIPPLFQSLKSLKAAGNITKEEYQEAVAELNKELEGAGNTIYFKRKVRPKKPIDKSLETAILQVIFTEKTESEMIRLTDALTYQEMELLKRIFQSQKEGKPADSYLLNPNKTDDVYTVISLIRRKLREGNFDLEVNRIKKPGEKTYYILETIEQARIRQEKENTDRADLNEAERQFAAGFGEGTIARRVANLMLNRMVTKEEIARQVYGDVNFKNIGRAISMIGFVEKRAATAGGKLEITEDGITLKISSNNQ